MKNKKIILGGITILLLATSLTSCGGCEHSYVLVKEVASTCSKEGVARHYVCEKCDQIFNENKEAVKPEDLIIPMSHKTIFIEGQNPTCTENGYYGHYQCEYCEKIFSDEDAENEISLTDITILAAGSHTLTTYEAVEPGCTTTGNIKYFHCEECDSYFTDEKAENEVEYKDVIINALNHNITRINEVMKTCDTDGVLEHFYCDRCDKHFEDENGTNEMTNNSWIIEAKHDLVHKTVQEATYTQDGISVEHYHCETCLKNFADESATQIITGDIVEYAYKKSFSFEDGKIYPYIKELSGASLSVVSDNSSFGNKALKAELGVNGKLSIAFDRNWLDKVFQLKDAEALYFDIKAEENANDFYYNSLSNQWGVVRYEPVIKDGAGVTKLYKTVAFTKAMLSDLASDNVVIRIDNSVNNVVYIDNIRLGKINNNHSFENNLILPPDSDKNYLVNSNYNDTLEVMVNTPNSTVELTNARASDGRVSLHIKSNSATTLDVYLPNNHYEALRGYKGIMFDVFIPSADVMHLYRTDDLQPYPYINSNNFNKWTTMYIKFEHIQMEGSYARILGTRNNANFNFDLYIDNIRPYEEYSMNFETENLLENNTDMSGAYGSLLLTDSRNTYTITDEQSYSGSYSLKISKPNESFTKGFGINHAMYANIPDNGGLKFYFFADGELNLTPNGEFYYYRDVVGTWKEMIIPKSFINSNPFDHYVFLICQPANVYIDAISIVNSI